MGQITSTLCIVVERHMLVKFFEKIIGYNVEVSREFAKKFTSTKVDFTSISFGFQKTESLNLHDYPWTEISGLRNSLLRLIWVCSFCWGMKP